MKTKIILFSALAFILLITGCEKPVESIPFGTIEKFLGQWEGKMITALGDTLYIKLDIQKEDDPYLKEYDLYLKGQIEVSDKFANTLNCQMGQFSRILDKDLLFFYFNGGLGQAMGYSFYGSINDSGTLHGPFKVEYSPMKYSDYTGNTWVVNKK